MLVDTHAHLQWPSLAGDIEGVLERARSAGIQRILTLGTEPQSCRVAVQLAESQRMVYAAVGIHPGDVTQDGEDELCAIVDLLDHPRVVAIGETGLDFFRNDGPPRDSQIAMFERHLDLAVETGMPISVHNREATADVMRMLDHYAGRVTAILHCFTGDAATASAAVNMGCYISFAGNATYPKLSDVLSVAAAVPADRLLVETDSPFLAPQPVRGRRNEPANITFTYDAIAAVRGTSRGDLARLVAANAERLFGWAVEVAA